MGVLINNFRGNEEPIEVRAEATGAVPPSAARKRVATGPFGEFAVDRPWPAPSVESLSDFDPLASDATGAPLAPQPNLANLNELRSAQDAIIFSADGQTVARVGQREYRVGDVVGGLTISDISSAGIVLRRPD